MLVTIYLIDLFVLVFDFEDVFETVNVLFIGWFLDIAVSIPLLLFLSHIIYDATYSIYLRINVLCVLL